MKRHTLLLSATALAMFALAGTARADADSPPEHRALGATLPIWNVSLGVRNSFVTDPGLNPFSTKDLLTQSSLGGQLTLFARGRFSFAAGILWDYGSSSASARGDTASLEVHRLAAPLEGRAAFAPWLYVFARTAPGFAAISASLEDPSAPATLAHTSWVPTVDLSGGVAYRIGGGGSRRSVGVWLTGEGGYGWAGRASLGLVPNLAADDPRRTGVTDMGSLALHGAYVRVGGAIGF